MCANTDDWNIGMTDAPVPQPTGVGLLYVGPELFDYFFIHTDHISRGNSMIQVLIDLGVFIVGGIWVVAFILMGVIANSYMQRKT